MNTLKCENCNKSILNPYTWQGKIYGIECWKKIALPIILAEREKKFAFYKKQEWEKSYALVEAIKQKDFSKIKSQFKIKFLKSLITQFEEKGFISKKQTNIVYGVNSFYGSMLNDKDNFNFNVAWYNIADEETKKWLLKWQLQLHSDYKTYSKDAKFIKKFCDAVGININKLQSI